MPPEIKYLPFSNSNVDEKLLQINPPEGIDILFIDIDSSFTFANICSF